MAYIEKNLGSVVANLSDQNYAQSLDFYRFWFDIGQAYHQIPSDQIFNAIWNNRGTNSIHPTQGKLTHPTAHLILRFASDAESDHTLAPQTSGLQNRLCARSLQEFLNHNAEAVCNSRGSSAETNLCSEANLIAHWANLGYVAEAAIRDHILQSLISHPTLYDHQADALVILFKLAGATFEAYADPLTVDRCFELLKGHKYYSPYDSRYCSEDGNRYAQARSGPLQVRATCAVKTAIGLRQNFRG